MSIRTMNWSGISLESWSRSPGDEEETIQYIFCLESTSGEAYPVVCVTASGHSKAFYSNRGVISRIASSVRFRPT
jgi:hypothetical protein